MNKSSTIVFSDKSIYYIFLKWSLLLVFLKSLYAWFTWDLNILIVNLVAIIAFAIFFLKKKKAFSFSAQNLLLCFLFLIVKIYTSKSGNINGFVGGLVSTILISYLICLKDEYKIDIIYFITKALAVLLSISLIAWALFLLGVSLPFARIDFNKGQYYYNNHYFFLFNKNSFYSSFPRFSSVFLEPGQLGMITASLLFIYQFKLKKKEILVIFIATIFTFSLAAYILSIVSILLIAFLNSKKPVTYTIILSILLFSTYSFITKYNNGDNILNTLIIKRLAYQDGDIAGNNRSTKYLSNYFTHFIKSEDNLIGIGEEYSKINSGGGNAWGNAGYKPYLIEHGIIGVFLVFIFYLNLSLRYKSKLTFFFLLIYILIFLQAAYPFWECMLIIYISALPLLKRNNLRLKIVE